MKNILASVPIQLTLTVPLSACPICRPKVAAGIYNEYFGVHLTLVLLPMLILSALVFVLSCWDDHKSK